MTVVKLYVMTYDFLQITEHINEMWRNRVVLLTLFSYSYFIHSYDRLRHIILILAQIAWNGRSKLIASFIPKYRIDLR